MPREIAEWYVMISGERVGPMSRAEVGMQASSGAIDGQTHCWKSGMAGWKVGLDVPELSGLFGGESEEPPPPPPPGKKPSSAGKRAPAAGGVDKSASASRPGGNKPGALKPVMSVRSAGVPARERAPGAGKLRSAYEASNDEVGKGLKELDTGHFRLAEENAEAPSGKNEGASEFDTNHFNLKNLAAEKEAMKKGGKGEGVQVFDTGHFNLKELDAQKEALKKGKPGGKGEGVQVFDTGHFNLKELDAQKEAMKKGAKSGGGKGEGVQVFDTGHFNLKELDAQKAAMKKGAKGKGEGVNEFDTGHFRLNDLKKPGGRPADKEPLDLDLDEVVHKAGISSPNEAPVGKRTPQAAPNPLPSTRGARATSDGVPVTNRPASARNPTPAPVKPVSQPAAQASARPVSQPSAARPGSQSSAGRPASQPGARPVSQPSARAPSQSSAGRPASQGSGLSQPNRPASARQPIDPRFAQPHSAYRSPPEEESGGSVALYLMGAVAVLALVGVYLLFR